MPAAADLVYVRRRCPRRRSPSDRSVSGSSSAPRPTARRGPKPPDGSSRSATRSPTMPDHFTEQLAPVPALQAILDATTTLARRCARVRQRLQASGDPGQGAGDDRRPVRGPRGDRARRRVDDLGLRADRPPVRPRRRAHRSFRRGARRDPRCDGARTVQLLGRALHGHRLRRAPEAGAGALPPDPHRWRRHASVGDRGPRGRHRRRQRNARGRASSEPRHSPR